MRFEYNGRDVVLEAQLAMISLRTIAERRQFYEKGNQTLVWITADFDPRYYIRTAVYDIMAESVGNIFSVKRESASTVYEADVFLLDTWVFDRDADSWRSHENSLTEAIWKLEDDFASQFKQEFVADFTGENLLFSDKDRLLTMLNRLFSRIGSEKITNLDARTTTLLKVIRALISMEVGRVVGARHPKLVSIVNSVLDGEHEEYRAYALVRDACRWWCPKLFEQRSVSQMFERAKARLAAEETAPAWNRHSELGKIRDVLFPHWVLDVVKERHDR